MQLFFGYKSVQRLKDEKTKRVSQRKKLTHEYQDCLSEYMRSDFLRLFFPEENE